MGRPSRAPRKATPAQGCGGAEQTPPDAQGELRGADMSHEKDRGPVKRSMLPVYGFPTLLWRWVLVLKRERPASSLLLFLLSFSVKL